MVFFFERLPSFPIFKNLTTLLVHSVCYFLKASLISIFYNELLRAKCLLYVHYGLQSQIGWLNLKKNFPFFDKNQCKYIGIDDIWPEQVGTSHLWPSTGFKTAKNGHFGQF